MLLLMLLQLNLSTLLETKVDIWLNNQISDRQILLFLEDEEEKLTTETTYDTLYNRSLINLYRGLLYFYNEEKEKSITYLERAIEYGERANKLKEASDNWRVISEAGSYLMLQKGVPYIIKHSKTVNDNALKALSLDRNNYKAAIIVANGLINAPKLFGGDKKKGIAILEGLTTENSTKEIQFSKLYSLSVGYKLSKKRTEALKYVKEALKIYPQNKQANELLLTLKG